MRTIKIILASRSPARRTLMQELILDLKKKYNRQFDLQFECHSSDYPEDMTVYKNPGKLAKFLALGKAKYIAHRFPDSIIIGADTFITIGSKKIGKPANRKEAREIITAMSGKTILVHSGLAVIKTSTTKPARQTHTKPALEIITEIVEHVVTKLTIKKMTAAEIRTLADADEALQISGAFSIEGEGGKMVERIDGDYNNVIGLPLFRLREILKENFQISC